MKYYITLIDSLNEKIMYKSIRTYPYNIAQLLAQIMLTIYYYRYNGSKRVIESKLNTAIENLRKAF